MYSLYVGGDKFPKMTRFMVFILISLFFAWNIFFRNYKTFCQLRVAQAFSLVGVVRSGFFIQCEFQNLNLFCNTCLWFLGIRKGRIDSFLWVAHVSYTSTSPVEFVLVSECLVVQGAFKILCFHGSYIISQCVIRFVSREDICLILYISCFWENGVSRIGSEESPRFVYNCFLLEAY